MRFLIALIMLSSLAFAEVVSGTLHLSDAQRVDDTMKETGETGLVSIVCMYDSLTNYVVAFPGNYNDNDTRGVSSFFVAVGIVSASTSWHSDMAIVYYDDITIMMYTEDCQTALQLLINGRDEEVVVFLENNMTTCDRI